MIGALIEAGMAATIFVGLPLMCWLDPAGHYAAEAAKRQAEKDQAGG